MQQKDQGPLPSLGQVDVDSIDGDIPVGDHCLRDARATETPRTAISGAGPAAGSGLGR
jgi:hypothetical protein